VDFMDYNISYYSIGSLGQRPWVRGLYSYPAIPGAAATKPYPDLATGAPTISNGGKTVAVTIRTGAMWNTSPPRQVTAADAVIGLKRSCNPIQPFGGLPDFQTLIAGYEDFCNGFTKLGSSATPAAMKKYIDTHQISGVTASGQTITYNLVHAASYFPTMLSMDPFYPAPVESLNYVPGSAANAQHLVADGPYMVQSYTPNRSIVYVRNPAWKASTDPIRKAYVDKIVVSETGNQTSIQQQLQTNTAAASMGFDLGPPIGAVPGLISQMKSGLTKNFNLGPTFSTNPYIVFNTVSPNNNKAMEKVAVRQALSYGINRAHLITDNGGPEQAPPLTHVLPPGINGAQDLPSGYNPDQGQADAGGGRVPERADPDPAVPPVELDREQDGHDPSGRPGEDRREAEAAGGHTGGLHRQVPHRPVRRQARRLGHHSRWLGPGLVRRRGPVVLRPAALGPALLSSGRQQLRVLQQPRGEQLDPEGRQRGVGVRGRHAMGAGGPGGHEGRAVLPDHRPAEPELPRELCAQRRVHPLYAAVRPDQCLAEFPRGMTASG
jgi:hypothetical protein